MTSFALVVKLLNGVMNLLLVASNWLLVRCNLVFRRFIIQYYSRRCKEAPCRREPAIPRRNCDERPVRAEKGASRRKRIPRDIGFDERDYSFFQIGGRDGRDDAFRDAWRRPAGDGDDP